ncbi:MAG: glycosyltransferase family 1 protein [Devosia sp.]
MGAELTGVQRYLSELLKRLPSVEALDAPAWARGPAGHAWEQFVLPARLGRKRLLWSPSNVGPVAVRRQVVTLHDLATLDFPEGFSAGFQAFYSWLLPRLLPRVDAIITVSEYTRTRALERFDLDPDRVRAIPLGVDHARFAPRPAKEIEAFREREKLPARYILFLGSLSTRKNIRGLLDAWRIAQQDVADDIYLIVAGGAGQAQFKGNAIDDLPPRTLPIGRVSEDDLPLLLGGAMLFAFPSLYEGFGLPPLEAMACGTPTLVGDVTSLPEVTGAAAILVDPHDIESIAEGLRIVDRPAELLGFASKGRTRALEFRWETAASKTRDVLEEFS